MISANGHVEEILYADPVWCAYAIADLQPAFAPYCTWYVGQDAGGEGGLALIFTALGMPTLFTAGPTSAVKTAIDTISLPERVYITVREPHMPYLATLYDFSADTRPMWRMTLPANGTPPAASRGDVKRLTYADTPRLKRLYAAGGDFAPDAFDPYQLESGVFFGVETADGVLAAAGGTHIVDWTRGTAAIGNMYTRADLRGRGYGRMILHAIVETLRAGAIHNIVLNVDRRNQAARHIYEAYGFTAYCPYFEGIGRLRNV